MFYLNLVMQKGSRVVQMIIAHKSSLYYFHILKMRSKHKVALAVELSILAPCKTHKKLKINKKEMIA